MNVHSGAYQPQLSRDRARHVFALRHLVLRCVFVRPSRLKRLLGRTGTVNSDISQADFEASRQVEIGLSIINVYYPPRVRAKQMSAGSCRTSAPHFARSIRQPGAQIDGRSLELREAGLALLDAQNRTRRRDDYLFEHRRG